MQAALAIPSCHNNPCKASAIHKDKAQLDAALFDPPFCSFAGRRWAARASRGASQLRIRKPRHLSCHPSGAGDPRQIVSRESVGHPDLPWSDRRCLRGEKADLVGLWSGSHTRWSIGHTAIRFVMSGALGIRAVEIIPCSSLP